MGEGESGVTLCLFSAVSDHLLPCICCFEWVLQSSSINPVCCELSVKCSKQLASECGFLLFWIPSKKLTGYLTIPFRSLFNFYQIIILSLNILCFRQPTWQCCSLKTASIPSKSWLEQTASSALTSVSFISRPAVRWTTSSKSGQTQSDGQMC